LASHYFAPINHSKDKRLKYYLTHPHAFFGLNQSTLVRFLQCLPNYYVSLKTMREWKTGSVFGGSDDSDDAYDYTFVSARTESRLKKTMRRIRRVGACCHLQIIEKEDNSYDVVVDRQRASNNRLLTSRLTVSEMDAMILEEQYYSMKKTEARDTVIESIRCKEQDGDVVTIRRRASGGTPVYNVTVNKTEGIKQPPTEFGVFAQRSFEKDDMILEYTGMVMNDVHARALESAYARQQRSCYMMWGDADWVIDASRRGGKARFVSSVDNVRHRLT
jgi:hypothetical protein